jgi:hypothetical protein
MRALEAQLDFNTDFTLACEIARGRTLLAVCVCKLGAERCQYDRFAHTWRLDGRAVSLGDLKRAAEETNT